MSNYIWPEIFMTGEKPKNYTREQAIADGLCGWAICMSGEEPCEKFGEGMVEIGSVVGCTLPEQLSKEADKILKERSIHEQTHP